MTSRIGAVAPASSSSLSLTQAVRMWAEGFNFGSASSVGRIDVPRAQAPTTGSSAMQRAYALYRTWEDNDLGSVRLLKADVGGKDVYALHTTTDGDDGFLELYSAQGSLLASGVTGFDAQGRRNVTWDAKPGAVRERVAPRDVSPSVTSFADAIDQARGAGSASGATVSKAELVAAAKHLVGSELSTASVDGYENARLNHVLADASTKLTSSSRAYAAALGQLYSDGPAAALSNYSKKPLGASGFSATAQLASGTVATSKAPPTLNTFIALSRRAFDALPTQVVPLTRTEAQKLLREAGASSTEAKAAVDAVADAKGQVYAGRFFEQGNDWVPKSKGLALFGVSQDGRTLKALNVLAKPPPPSAVDPKAVVEQLLGVSRDVSVVSRAVTPAGEQLDLRWRPTWGGALEAKLTVPSDGGEPVLSGVKVPHPLEEGLRTGLAQRLDEALGRPQKVLGWVGADSSAGVAFVAAHQDAAGGPVKMSTIRIAMGGATASVTPYNPSSEARARELALVLARAHAHQLVADPSVPEAARLEVALRTGWAMPQDLSVPPPDESAVGFDPAKERYQFQLSSVWGDNAVFVTFAKNGQLRIEDFN